MFPLILWLPVSLMFQLVDNQLGLCILLSYPGLYLYMCNLVFKYSSCVLQSLRLNIAIPIPLNFGSAWASPCALPWTLVLSILISLGFNSDSSPPCPCLLGFTSDLCLTCLIPFGFVLNFVHLVLELMPVIGPANVHQTGS